MAKKKTASLPFSPDDARAIMEAILSLPYPR